MLTEIAIRAEAVFPNLLVIRAFRMVPSTAGVVSPTSATAFA
jgi:hypothetical protein